ncbi:MAG TPA: glycosyltransferase [Nitrospira sp.]|nr:glycosyltransferase [Nitrospira sp.]
MERETRVVQICPCYVDLERETGGVANIVRQICLHLAKQEIDVLLLCGNRELGTVKAQPGVRRIGRFLSMEVYGQLAHPLLGPTKALTRRLASLDGRSVAHVHTCFSAFSEAAMRACHSRGIPFVFTPHGKLSPHSWAAHHWAKDLWWTVKASKAIEHAAIIAVSSGEEAEQLQRFAFRSAGGVVPNGYDASAAEEFDGAAPFIPPPYVLFLGYLDPRKQPEFLVEAFARSQASRRRHRLVFAGPDCYGQQSLIRRRAESLGLLDSTVFFGPAYGDAKWNLLQHASCLCLPSLGEGLPLVLCEALGAGTPTIVSRACNFPDIAAEGAGLLLENFDPAQWADAIDRISLDETVRLGMRDAARSLRAHYAWDAIVRRWSGLYASLSKSSASLQASVPA